jgi:hypothetical protein
MLKQYFHLAKQFILGHKKTFIALTAIIFLTGIFEIIAFYNSTKKIDSNYEDFFSISYNSFKVNIPKNLNFAGEKVPIKEPTVRRAIARELQKNIYEQTHSLFLHKRASRWFPIIEPILKRNKIPDDFKYLAIVESQLTNAVSPQGATGFWQLIGSTAQGYGLEITNDVDERYHVEKSTEAACKYFKEAHKMFNNWTLVAASYNRGMGGIQTQLNKQNTESYYKLLLTAETARYIYKVLAIKEIISRPKVYGYQLKKGDLYGVPATRKIKIDSTINDLNAFAIAQGADYQTLKTLNPWLISNSLTNSSEKKYIIEFPKKGTKIVDIEKETTPFPLSNKDSTTIIKPLQTNDSIKKE